MVACPEIVGHKKNPLPIFGNGFIFSFNGAICQAILNLILITPGSLQ